MATRAAIRTIATIKKQQQQQQQQEQEQGITASRQACFL